MTTVQIHYLANAFQRVQNLCFDLAVMQIHKPGRYFRDQLFEFQTLIQFLLKSRQPVTMNQQARNQGGLSCRNNNNSQKEEILMLLPICEVLKQATAHSFCFEIL